MNHHSSIHSEPETTVSRTRKVLNSRFRKLTEELTETRLEKYIALAFLEKLIWEHEDQSIKLAALEYWFRLVGEGQQVNS
ncbi:MAG TPA: hypothetical protein DIT74_04495 [Pseudoalteromonas sp.]|nr:hypothetical protein [Pseudoalteromonas sp.]